VQTHLYALGSEPDEEALASFYKTRIAGKRTCQPPEWKKEKKGKKGKERKVKEKKR
jgi:hypothetical protein